MCSIKVMSVVEAETARRTFLRSMGAAAVGLGATAAGVRAASANHVPSQFGRAVHFEKVIDLTHVLEPNIPNYFRLNMQITPLLTVESNGVYVNRLSVPEHYGTHFDTPAHFIRRGATGESIAPEQLVGPLVIIDIAARASSDPNAYPAHFAVLGAGKIGVENFAGLDHVLRQIERRKQAGTEGHPLIFIGGLKTRGGSGSPIRALALV